MAVVELDMLNHRVYLPEMEVDTVLCVSIAHNRSRILYLLNWIRSNIESQFYFHLKVIYDLQGELFVKFHTLIHINTWSAMHKNYSN